MSFVTILHYVFMFFLMGVNYPAVSLTNILHNIVGHVTDISLVYNFAICKTYDTNFPTDGDTGQFVAVDKRHLFNTLMMSCPCRQMEKST